MNRHRWSIAIACALALLFVLSSAPSAPAAPTSWSTARPATPRPALQASYGVDSSLAVPQITAVKALDNAIILSWSDVNTTHSGYLIMVWDRNSSLGPTEFRLPSTARAAWIANLVQGPVLPHGTYDIHLRATGPKGVSGVAVTTATLPVPTVTVHDLAFGFTFTRSAAQGFAPWDADGDGIVRGASAGGGAYPYFQSTSGASPGNMFDSFRTRANVILGYFLDQFGVPRFVAFHLLIDSLTNVATPVSVAFGDEPIGLGPTVWVTNEVVAQLDVINGDTALGTPNRVEGRVTSSEMKVSGLGRAVEYRFSLALTPQ